MGRKCKETSLEERKIIINLHQKGKSYANISSIVKRSRSTQCIVNKYKKDGMLQNFPRCGRPRY